MEPRKASGTIKDLEGKDLTVEFEYRLEEAKDDEGNPELHLIGKVLSESEDLPEDVTFVGWDGEETDYASMEEDVLWMIEDALHEEEEDEEDEEE